MYDKMDLATTTAETGHRRRMASPEAQQQLDSSPRNTDYASMMESSNDGIILLCTYYDYICCHLLLVGSALHCE